MKQVEEIDKAIKALSARQPGIAYLCLLSKHLDRYNPNSSFRLGVVLNALNQKEVKEEFKERTGCEINWRGTCDDAITYMFNDKSLGSIPPDERPGSYIEMKLTHLKIARDWEENR